MNFSKESVRGKKVSCFIFRVQEKKNREEVRREEGRQGLEGEGKRKKGRRGKKKKKENKEVEMVLEPIFLSLSVSLL